MKLTITHHHFLRALRLAERIAAQKADLTILQYLLLEAKEGQSFLRATNLHLGVEARFPSKVEEEGVVALPRKVVTDFVQSLPSEGTITLSSDGKDIVLQSGTYVARVPYQDPEEFPSLPSPRDSDHGLTFYPENIQSIFKRLLVSVSSSEIRPEFTGIFLEVHEGGEIHFASTDSFRLTTYHGQAPFRSNPFSSQIIIPRAAATEVVRIAGEQEKGEVNILFEEGQLFFLFDDVTLITQLIDGKFPEYRQIIPSSFATEVKVSRHDLEQALRALGVFSSERESGEIRLLFQGETKTLCLQVQSPSYGEAESTLSLEEYNGEDQNILLNVRYLLQGVGVFSESDTLSLACVNDTSPLVIRSGDEGEKEDTSFLYLVMPLRK